MKQPTQVSQTSHTACLSPHHEARRKLILLTGLPFLVLMGIGYSTLHSSQIQRHVGDLSLYVRASALLMQGRLPYRDFRFEYPPLALLPLTLPRWLAFGHALDPQSYLLLLLIENAVFATMIAAGLAQISAHFSTESRTGNAERESVMTRYALLIVIGSPLVPWRYDLFPALLTLLALRFVLKGRPAIAGFWLGLGIAAKLYPVVLLPPLAIYYLVQKQCPSVAFLALGASGGLALSLLPFSAVGPPKMLSFLAYHTQRGLEVGSLPAGIILLLHGAGLTPAGIVFNFGAFHVASPLSGVVISCLPAAFLLLFGAVQVLTLRGFRNDAAAHGGVRPDTLVKFLIAALLAFIVTNKVYSPQYIIWLLPFAPLLRPRAGLEFAALWGLTIAIFPFAFPFLITLSPAAVLLLNLRNGLSVILLLDLLRERRGAPLSSHHPILPIIQDRKVSGKLP